LFAAFPLHRMPRRAVLPVCAHHAAHDGDPGERCGRLPPAADGGHAREEGRAAVQRHVGRVDGLVREQHHRPAVAVEKVIHVAGEEASRQSKIGPSRMRR